jgi:diamine N-acetyltransferase
MIDKRFQAKGYGKATMLVILEELKKEKVERVLLKYHKDNQAAQKLYKSLGFVVLESTPTHITAQCLLD